MTMIQLLLDQLTERTAWRYAAHSISGDIYSSWHASVTFPRFRMSLQAVLYGLHSNASENISELLIVCKSESKCSSVSHVSDALFL